MTILGDGTQIAAEPPVENSIVVTPGSSSVVIGNRTFEVENPIDEEYSLEVPGGILLPDGTVVTVDAPSDQELELLVIRGEKGDTGDAGGQQFYFGGTEPVAGALPILWFDQVGPTQYAPKLVEALP